ncbi:hypothetical protein GCM10023155_46700 [Bremerella cremea]
MRRFYCDGTVKYEGEACFGEKNGIGRGFYPDGTLWWVGIHNRGEFVVESRDPPVFYTEDGLIDDQVDTAEEMLEELKRWHNLRSEGTCESMQEFAMRIEKQ